MPILLETRLWRELWLSRRQAMLLLAATCALFSAPAAGGEGILTHPAVRTSFFNPTLGQQTEIEFDVSRAGVLVLTILDRDGFEIRRLDPVPVEPGRVVLRWDGRDRAGQVVPDEAYSPRIEWQSGEARETYDPLANFEPVVEEVRAHYYSRIDGILSYSLSRPSRVHIQAGQARIDPQTGEGTGPILKTLVDRPPRAQGRVVEFWNGMDESGTIRVPELRDFVVAILATSLPENCLITVGNRAVDFRSYAAAERPAFATRPRQLQADEHRHHRGLNALEDHSPNLALRSSADAGTPGRLPRSGRSLDLTVEIAEPEAAYFLAQPHELTVFVDEKAVLSLPQPPNPVRIRLGPGQLPPGTHRVAVNWASKLGPVGVQAVVLVVDEATATPAGGGQ